MRVHGYRNNRWQDILYVSVRDSHPGEIPDNGDSGCKLAGYAVDHRTLYLAEKISRRQAVAELLVETANKFVIGNMGEKFSYMIPFVAALFATSVVSNLISLVGLRSPTADLSTEAAWAVVVFTMITAQKIKTNGFGGYMKGFTTPIPIMTPFNILSEIATPISMACRHFGNILSGVVINGLIYAALALASSKLFGLIPGIVGDVLSKIPFLDVGIPAIMSVYFDWFSGIMQAFIFCMLTVMYIANAAEE